MQCWGESVLIAMYARCLTTIDVQYGDRLRGSFKDMAGVSECTYAVHGRSSRPMEPSHYLQWRYGARVRCSANRMKSALHRTKNRF